MSSDDYTITAGNGAEQPLGAADGQIGDVVLDADGQAWQRCETYQRRLGWRGFNGALLYDMQMREPLTLVARDGKPVSGGSSAAVTGEATESLCSTCGAPMDAPACSLDPDTGWSGHTIEGGCADAGSAPGDRDARDFPPDRIRPLADSNGSEVEMLHQEYGTEDDLPGAWSYSDFTGGDPDERSYTERGRSAPR